jgi:hypothetical protein
MNKIILSVAILRSGAAAVLAKPLGTIIALTIASCQPTYKSEFCSFPTSRNFTRERRLNFELRVGKCYSHSLASEAAIVNFMKNVMQVQNQVLDEWEMESFRGKY